jgi:hypothetical protein
MPVSRQMRAADPHRSRPLQLTRAMLRAKALDEHGANKDVRRRFPTQRSGRRWTIPAGRHFSPGPRHLGGHGTRGHDERNSNDELWRQFHKSAAADWVPAGHHFSPTQGNRGGMGEHHPNELETAGVPKAQRPTGVSSRPLAAHPSSGWWASRTSASEELTLSRAKLGGAIAPTT